MSERVYQDRGGVKRSTIVDNDRPGAVTVHTRQVLDEVLDGIARDREIMPQTGPNKLVARVPITVYEQSVREGWGDDDWKRYLNSSDATPFRIWRGQV
jgi:hypothetical protein